MIQTTIVKGKVCKDCEFEIISICCNGDLWKTEPYKGNDWWIYCSNKLCKNHKGEGEDQCGASFAKDRK